MLTCDNERTMVYRAMKIAVMGALGGLLVAGIPASAVAKKAKPEKFSFDMVVSAGAASCLPKAQGRVTISAAEDGNQKMHVSVEGLARHATFTLFVLQVPTGPFAMSWYQGDIETNGDGRGGRDFFGIFSDETFIIAPAAGRQAPQTHPGVDAVANPATAPVHTYHLGMWFDDPADAIAAGCPATVTPFNGDHNAGIQVLNTRNFTDTAGPLGFFK